MRIFHISTLADWEAARASGAYTTSTRGRTLAEEGYIHTSRGDQWQGVRERYYADVEEPLVLLVIDRDALSSPVVDEPVPGGETFPHVYGPIDPAAVVQVIPLETALAAVARPADPTPPTSDGAVAPVEPGPSFSRIYLQEMFRNVLVASVVLLVVVVATLVGQVVDDDWGPLIGALLGLVVGVVVVRLVFYRSRA